MPDDPKTEESKLKPWMTLVVALVGSVTTALGGHYVLGRDNVKHEEIPAIQASSPYVQDKPELEDKQKSMIERERALTDRVKKLEKRIKDLEDRIGQ